MTEKKSRKKNEGTSSPSKNKKLIVGQETPTSKVGEECPFFEFFCKKLKKNNQNLLE